MKIPKLFLHDTVTDWLHTLFFQGECIGSETITVYSYFASQLTIPVGAQYALIVVEAAPAVADKSKVLRFWEDGSFPTASFGIPLGELGVYEVKGKENMNNFAMIGIEAFYSHSVQVQYFA